MVRWAIVGAFLLLCVVRPMYVFLVVSLPTLVPEFAGNDYLIPAAFAGMALAVVIVVYVIAMVLAQRKQVALYLRHFRMSQAAHNMASVLQVRFNGQCRLVTLDDSTFRPMDTGRGYKSLRFVIVLAILAIVGTLVAIAVYSLIKFTPTIGGIVLAYHIRVSFHHPALCSWVGLAVHAAIGRFDCPFEANQEKVAPGCNRRNQFG